jgi:hypothetical protein
MLISTGPDTRRYHDRSTVEFVRMSRTNSTLGVGVAGVAATGVDGASTV